MSNKMTKEDLTTLENELKAKIEFEKSVDARQTVAKLEKKLDMVRLALIGLAVVSD